MASRARDFFLLSRGSLTSLVGNPGEITSAVVAEAVENLKREVLEAIEEARSVVARFPPKSDPFRKADGSQWYPAGVLVVLTRSTHPLLFRSLERIGSCDFVLDAATPESVLPASDEEPTLAARMPDEPYTGRENPFAGKANVRISRARVFMEGARTSNGRLVVRLVHRGSERLCRPDGDLFPSATEDLIHSEVASGFEYRIGQYRYDEEYGFPAEVIDLSGMAGFGDFSGVGDVQDVRVSYAGVGPFGHWEIALSENENPGLELAAIDRILIDFHGSCERFT
jgi:hypothetical protein